MFIKDLIMISNKIFQTGYLRFS